MLGFILKLFEKYTIFNNNRPYLSILISVQKKI